jgi:hypothetical protein
MSGNASLDRKWILRGIQRDSDVLEIPQEKSQEDLCGAPSCSANVQIPDIRARCITTTSRSALR